MLGLYVGAKGDEVAARMDEALECYNAALKLDPPAKTRLAEIHGVSFTADGKELIGVFSYWDIKPDYPPGVDGFIHAEQNCLERWDIARGVRVVGPGVDDRIEGFNAAGSVDVILDVSGWYS